MTITDALAAKNAKVYTRADAALHEARSKRATVGHVDDEMARLAKAMLDQYGPIAQFQIVLAQRLDELAKWVEFDGPPLLVPRETPESDSQAVKGGGLGHIGAQDVTDEQREGEPAAPTDGESAAGSGAVERDQLAGWVAEPDVSREGASA